MKRILLVLAMLLLTSLYGWTDERSAAIEHVKILVAELKDQMRDPDSFVTERVQARKNNKERGGLCIWYRAKNGMGGYNRAVAFVWEDKKGNMKFVSSTNPNTSFWDSAPFGEYMDNHIVGEWCGAKFKGDVLDLTKDVLSPVYPAPDASTPLTPVLSATPIPNPLPKAATSSPASTLAPAPVVIPAPAQEETLGEVAKRNKQHKACLELAKDNPSVMCK
ncbi:MAG: hypothetical protein LAN64_01840 [Acidobacteriia bacterium]|nr:hypothetical protein [Terriglobia bacterium]